MIRFSWKKIHNESKGNIASIVNILYLITYKEIPYNKRDKLYKWANKDYLGHSFILNPEPLFIYKNKEFTPAEMVEYVYLASLRSYVYWDTTGILTLPREHSTISIDRIQANKLLELTETSIKFKFEENKEWH